MGLASADRVQHTCAANCNLPIEQTCAKDVITAERQAGYLKVGIPSLGGKRGRAVAIWAVVRNIQTRDRGNADCGSDVVGIDDVLIAVPVVLEVGIEGVKV